MIDPHRARASATDGDLAVARESYRLEAFVHVHDEPKAIAVLVGGPLGIRSVCGGVVEQITTIAHRLIMRARDA